jgi:hypothetical protein
MTDDGRTHMPGAALRTGYLASLAPLAAYLGFLAYAILSPNIFRTEFDQLGMTDPGISFQTLDLLATAGRVVSAAGPLLAMALLVPGWPVLKRGSRRTLKILLAANGTLVMLMAVFVWYLPFVELQRRLHGGA